MKAILVDISKCTGCEKCVAACIKENKLNKDKADYDKATSVDGLSDNRLLSIVSVGEGVFARKSCMHCVEPSCVAACLVGGITKSENGAVIYDPSKCIGCRYCMLSCPYHIPRYEWSATLPYMKKCNMCPERLAAGEIPACVEACPSKAIIFGEREELLKEAKRIISMNKGKYINRVWGESELGGTSVLYISNVDLSGLGFAGKTSVPIPEITDPLIEKTPFIGMGVGAGLIGLSWIVRRRNELGSKNGNKKHKEIIEDNEDKNHAK